MSPDRTWRKSTFSENGPDCVEVRNTLDRLRDSKNAGPILHADIQALTRTIRMSAFNR